ncbi:hypothetical protein [Calothrix sp. PCC 6303]|uniref:hypothetical protein n=1 Tax=Calothrix sp. PCC 6303 TaxID=1170562 RepID=UPI0002A001B7|nr:hypothetical protein [Calothrix sp. PCC 6303]AFZ02987.1 hypothetical protein Cal6303_4071 [Calothrix sp. PCC 6303]
MANNIKEQIKTDLQQVKETGQLRIERIREIVRLAVSGVISELKQGSNDARWIVNDAVTAVTETLQERGEEFKEEVTASIEGALEAVNSKRHENIAKTQAEVKQLQSKLDTEEANINQEVDEILREIQEKGQTKSSQAKVAIDSAVESIKNSEEFALLQKRYAQLQSQLAIAKANLSARYGGRTEEINGYLEDAKQWYNKTLPQPEVIVEQVKEKHLQLDEKLAEAGSALARKERQIKHLLRDLLLSASNMFKDKEADNQVVDKEREVVRK